MSGRQVCGGWRDDMRLSYHALFFLLVNPPFLGTLVIPRDFCVKSRSLAISVVLCGVLFRGT
jgi:hypothetical protein